MTIVSVQGQEIEFPDTMGQDEIKAVLQKKFPPAEKGFLERYACDAAAGVPSAVDQRSCHRFRVEQQQPEAGLSEHSVDVLAEHRRVGYDLGETTRTLLDAVRPDGPSTNLRSRRPRYPVPVH